MSRKSRLDHNGFEDHLLKQGIRHKLIPRGRYGEFNLLVERTIGIPRVMTCAALQYMHLDDSFWVHATNYATFPKARPRLAPARQDCPLINPGIVRSHEIYVLVRSLEWYM